MNIRKTIIIALFVALGQAMVFADNVTEIRRGIQESLDEFASALSYINDPDEPTDPSTIAKMFSSGSSSYIYYNGRSMPDMESIIREYNRKVLGNRLVEHEFDYNINSINKISDKDRRWSVKANLIRRPSDPSKDYLIKTEPIEMIVKWNGQGKNVTILDIKLAETLTIATPKLYYSYNFYIKREPSLVASYGGDWKSQLVSTRETIKKYPGIDDKGTVIAFETMPFTLYATSPNATQTKLYSDPTSGDVAGQVGSNYSKELKVYTYSFQQKGSNKSLTLSVRQARREKDNPLEFNADDMPYAYLSLKYGTKYTFGLSVVARPEDSRFVWGISAGFNAQFFRNYQTTEWSTSTTELGVANGYRVTATHLNPAETGYSWIFDPYNEAVTKTARTEVLAMGGFNILKWLRFDLGVGVAYSRETIKVPDGWYVTEYKYEPEFSNLPPIPNVYARTRTGYPMRFCKSKYAPAFQPGLTFEIPVGESYDYKAITIGMAYTITPGLKGGNSFEISLGFGFNE